jgi:hypothetical protein
MMLPYKPRCAKPKSGRSGVDESTDQPKSASWSDRTGVGHIIEPLLSIDDLSVILKCSRRLVERMRSAGKLPPPDLHVGRCPRWKPETIRQYIEGKGV